MSTRVNTSVVKPLTVRLPVCVTPPNPQPITMTLHGRQPPVGDHFRPDQTLFPSSLAIGDNKYLHYHVIVWTKLFGQDTSDYGCVYVNGDGLRLCFNSKASLQKFEHWWKRYQRVFFRDNEIRESYAPYLSTGKLSGYFVEDVPTPAFGNIGGGSFGIQGSLGSVGVGSVTPNPNPPTYLHAQSHQTISETFLPDWVNIVRHSGKRVARVSNGWFFASAKDGIMFKFLQES